jgi:tetratricopeptide (TPR) repeat protein
MADHTGYRPVQAEARLSLATTSGRMGRSAAMQGALLDALDLALVSRHDETLARTLNFLTLSSLLTGDLDQAHVWARLAKSAIERLGGHPEFEANRHYNLGMLAAAEGRTEEVIEQLQAFLTLEQSRGPHPGAEVRLAHAWVYLGRAHRDLGRFDEARSDFERSLREGTAAAGPDHPIVATSLHGLGDLSLRQGDAVTAESYFRRSFAIFEKLPGTEPAYALLPLAQALLAQDRAAEAVPLLEKAIRIHQEKTKDPIDLARCRLELAKALWMRNRPGDRPRALRQAGDAATLFGRLGSRAQSEREEVEAWLAARGEGG